jgi:hypothetical protein
MTVIRGSQVPLDAPSGGAHNVDPLQGTAAEVFAEQFADDQVPSIRTIRARLHVGKPRAQLLRDYLAGGAGAGQGLAT